jgi:8-oxo-dGTP pyrophosphatase MutT (NUDIX family)/GNAT superfamily N-acetyltransferase
MKFELVRERLHVLPAELPAAPAILTPIRLDSPDDLFPAPRAGRGRQAGVLVLLFPDDEGEARVLLTTRVASLSSHAGEVSFPGGSAEPGDVDPAATAIREATEEVGLDPVACGLRVAGALDRFPITVSGFRITPVLALAERRPECRANPAEVARIIEPPVEAFLPDAPVELEERTIRERLIRYGAYPVEGQRVWGATARILGQLGALLAVERSTGRTSGPPAAPAPPGRPIELAVRPAGAEDRPSIDRFLEALAPDLASRLSPVAELFVAESSGTLVGLASWAPWDRDRPDAEPRGFDGLTFTAEERPAELTLLAVAPQLRGRGVGHGLTDAIATAAQSAGSRLLLAWTLADTAIEPTAVAARAFFRSNAFTDLVVDRRYQAQGEDRLLLERRLD